LGTDHNKHGDGMILGKIYQLANGIKIKTVA